MSKAIMLIFGGGDTTLSSLDSTFCEKHLVPKVVEGEDQYLVDKGVKRGD
jgi:hypothetical protein